MVGEGKQVESKKEREQADKQKVRTLGDMKTSRQEGRKYTEAYLGPELRSLEHAV